MTGRRKRRWDQSDEASVDSDVSANRKNENRVDDETGKPVGASMAAAAQIAAKIKASLVAKGIEIDEKVEEPNTHIHEIPAAEPAEGLLTEKKEEKSLLESLGIATGEQKTSEEKLKHLDEFSAFSQTVDINDTRHRYFLCKPATLEAIEKDFGVTVVTKGKYCPDRRLATEKDPPLCLEIHGSVNENVEKAVTRLRELIESGPPLPPVVVQVMLRC